MHVGSHHRGHRRVSVRGDRYQDQGVRAADARVPLHRRQRYAPRRSQQACSTASLPDLTLRVWCQRHPGRGYGGVFARWLEQRGASGIRELRERRSDAGVARGIPQLPPAGRGSAQGGRGRDPGDPRRPRGHEGRPGTRVGGGCSARCLLRSPSRPCTARSASCTPRCRTRFGTTPSGSLRVVRTPRSTSPFSGSKTKRSPSVPGASPSRASARLCMGTLSSKRSPRRLRTGGTSTLGRDFQTDG